MEGEDDVYRFQDVGSDTEMTGVNVEHEYQQPSRRKQLLNKDDLYFNDMDIRAWERRTAALGDASDRNNHGYPEDEDCYDDSGVPLSAAEYEEALFQRVLDKIRLARAAGVPDVQLTPEELDAYQSKLHGPRVPAARSPQSPRRSPLTDVMSVANSNAASKKVSSSSRNKKEQQRLSLFASKPKKEKSSNHKRAPSNASNAPPPGFVIPGPDGQPIYTPINAYQGHPAHDPTVPLQPVHRTAPHDEQHPTIVHVTPTEMPGAFPGALPTSPHLYRPSTPVQNVRSSQRDLGHGYESLDISGRASTQCLELKTASVEPYQYHDFSSSSSQSSPKLKYTRRVSSAESSYTAMPRRVPVPAQRPVSMQTSYSGPNTSPHTSIPGPERVPSAPVEGVAMVDVDAQTDSGKSVKSSSKHGSGSGGVKDGERRRKSGKSRKKL